MVPPSLRSVTATIALFLALYRPDHNRSANADAVTIRVTPRRSSASKSALSPVTSQSARPASPRPSRKSSRRWTAGSRFGISASVGIVVERLFEIRKHTDRQLDWCSVWQFGKLELSHVSGSPVREYQILMHHQPHRRAGPDRNSRLDAKVMLVHMAPSRDPLTFVNLHSSYNYSPWPHLFITYTNPT